MREGGFGASERGEDRKDYQEINKDLGATAKKPRCQARNKEGQSRIPRSNPPVASFPYGSKQHGPAKNDGGHDGEDGAEAPMRVNRVWRGRTEDKAVKEMRKPAAAASLTSQEELRISQAT